MTRKKYCYVATNFTYASAEYNCNNQNAILFEPKTDNENTYVFTKFLYHMRDLTWIGINDRKNEGSFVYTSTSEPITYSGSWGAGQPDDNSPGNDFDEDCVVYKPSTLGAEKWNDE